MFQKKKKKTILSCLKKTWYTILKNPNVIITNSKRSTNNLVKIGYNIVPLYSDKKINHGIGT